jgi:hypothetical protein
MNPPALAPRRTTSGQRFALAAIAVLLLAGVGFQLFRQGRGPADPVGRTRLADSVPRAFAGWNVTEERLGPTEGVSQSVLKTLNLDDYVYRSFRRGPVQFTIYAAYWSAGKMPTRLVASHTPDRCWSENGLRCLDMQFRQILALGGRPLLPAEIRTFVGPSGEDTIHVAYWHLVGGRIYDYGARFNAVPSVWLWWQDVVAQAAYGSREQVFVRLVSPLPIERLWTDPDFGRIFAEVAALGLYSPPTVAR